MNEGHLYSLHLCQEEEEKMERRSFSVLHVNELWLCIGHIGYVHCQPLCCKHSHLPPPRGGDGVGVTQQQHQNIRNIPPRRFLGEERRNVHVCVFPSEPYLTAAFVLCGWGVWRRCGFFGLHSGLRGTNSAQFRFWWKEI